jgi:hypothetical protein
MWLRTGAAASCGPAGECFRPEVCLIQNDLAQQSFQSGEGGSQQAVAEQGLWSTLAEVLIV